MPAAGLSRQLAVATTDQPAGCHLGAWKPTKPVSGRSGMDQTVQPLVSVGVGQEGNTEVEADRENGDVIPELLQRP